MTTNVDIKPRGLFYHPPGSFEKKLYQQLFAITINRSYSEGFRSIAGQVAHMGWEAHPTDLSIEAIRAALVDTAKRERKAHRRRPKRVKAYSAPWPKIWDAFIDTAKNGCRFHRWCRGKCKPENGERSHWSIGHSISDLHYGDRLGVQIYQYEDADTGVTEPAEIHLAYRSGDGAVPSVDLILSPVEARKVGEAIKEAPTKKLSGRHGHWVHPEPGTVIDVAFGAGGRLVVDRVPQRTRRNAEYPEDTEFEINLYSADNARPSRMRASESTAHFFARFLTFSADDAEGVIEPMSEIKQKSIEEAGR